MSVPNTKWSICNLNIPVEAGNSSLCKEMEMEDKRGGVTLAMDVTHKYLDKEVVETVVNLKKNLGPDEEIVMELDQKAIGWMSSLFPLRECDEVAPKPLKQFNVVVFEGVTWALNAYKDNLYVIYKFDANWVDRKQNFYFHEEQLGLFLNVIEYANHRIRFPPPRPLKA